MKVSIIDVNRNTIIFQKLANSNHERIYLLKRMSESAIHYKYRKG